MVAGLDNNNLTYILNPGAAFGLMAGRTWIFIVTALLVIGAIIFAQFYVPQQAKLMRLI